MIVFSEKTEQHAIKFVYRYNEGKLQALNKKLFLVNLIKGDAGNKFTVS